MTFSTSRWITGIAVFFMTLLVLIGGHAVVGQITGNFHEIIPGELYRSGQPDPDDIDEYARRYGIKSIINLRDDHRGDDYALEKSAARRNGILLINVPLSSGRQLSIEESSRLVALMEKAPKPLLVHCEHGANRTGLAAALYVSAVANKSDAEGRLQLSPFFGHFPIPGVGRYEMYRSWSVYEEWDVD